MTPEQFETVKKIVNKYYSAEKIECTKTTVGTTIVITLQQNIKLIYYVDVMTLWVQGDLNLKKGLRIDNNILGLVSSYYSNLDKLEMDLYRFFSKGELDESAKNFVPMLDLIKLAKEKGVTEKDLFSSYKFIVDPVKFIDILTKDCSPSYKTNAYKRIELNREYEPFYKALKAFIDGNPVPRLDPAKVDKHNRPCDGRHRAALCHLLNIQLPVEKM